MTDGPGRLRDCIAGCFLPDPPDPLGVAVSGGSDSLALLTLLNDWRGTGGPALHAVTVDHGLRSEAAEEAETVARLCAGWNIPHTTLRWDGWDGHGNLPDQARRARYRLMADWARERGIGCLALGHTADDQAETFLMRLAREAGVDGLSAMASRWEQGGVIFTRPALSIPREALRDVLRVRDLRWIDDPTNENTSYERARARMALAALAPLDIDALTLCAVAGHMAEARDALYAQVAETARDTARIEGGDVVFDRARLAGLASDIARRLLQEALLWVSGAEYPPRGTAMSRSLEQIGTGHSLTLHGCRLITRADTLRVTREEKAVAEHFVLPGEVWDGRWRLTGPDMEDARIGALGEAGLSLCPGRRNSALPAASLRASPAVWRGGTLIAAPLAGLDNGWRAGLVRRDHHDFVALLSH